MRRHVAVLLAALTAFQPLSLAAQTPVTPSSGPQQQTPPAAQTPPLPTLEAMGVSFERIKRELRIVPATKNQTPLKLDYYVEVQGFAPALPLFTPEELRAGPVPGGPPTHWEMVRELWTKPEFKGQAVPISSLVILGVMKVAQWQADRIKREKAEAALRLRQEELKAKYPDIVKQ
jgi:hypothetical protein